MMNHKIDFRNISWEAISIGAQQKEFRTKNKRVRLLRLEEDFVETDWCTSDHIGYVIDGEISIDFQGKIIKYKKGDALIIKGGETEKHKAFIEKGKFAVLFLIEEISID